MADQNPLQPLDTDSLTDEIKVRVERTAGEVDVSMEASGNVTIGASTQSQSE